jgi:tetratricopeptide (TPR) repeat protein
MQVTAASATVCEFGADGHRSKSKFLLELSRLYQVIGDFVGEKRLLTHCLKLEREQGSDIEVARMLTFLSGVNGELGLYAEGVEQAREAAGILERVGSTVVRADSWDHLSRLLQQDGQLDAAEEAAYRAINLLPEEGQESRLCQSHRVLGEIFRSKGEREKAIEHFEIALEIASAFKLHNQLFWINYFLAGLFAREDKFDDANVYIERAKTHAASNKHHLGVVMEGQAVIWYVQGKLGDAASEALAALKTYKKLGPWNNERSSEGLVRKTERKRTGKLLEIVPLPMFFNPPQHVLHFLALRRFGKYSKHQQTSSTTFPLSGCFFQARYFFAAFFTFSEFFLSLRMIYFVLHSLNTAGHILYRTG